MKNAVIFGILFCLVTLNLPKAFFHSHEHQEHHAEGVSDFSFSIDDADCFVCDIHLSNYTFLELNSIKFDPKAFVQGKEHVYFFESSKYYDFHQRRGPPSII